MSDWYSPRQSTRPRCHELHVGDVGEPARWHITASLTAWRRNVGLRDNEINVTDILGLMMYVMVFMRDDRLIVYVSDFFVRSMIYDKNGR